MAAQDDRRRLTEAYRRRLRDLPGLVFQEDMPGVRHNYAYFAVIVDPGRFGVDRDALHALLDRFNVKTRKYFHPLCSHFSCYANLPSARPANLPVAERVAERVLCLPLYGTLEEETVGRIADVLAAIHAAA